MRRASPFLAVTIAAFAWLPVHADAPAPPPPATHAPAAASERQAAPARTATRIPEPDTIALFVLGASGLLVGRRLSRSGRRRVPDA